MAILTKQKNFHEHEKQYGISIIVYRFSIFETKNLKVTTKYIKKSIVTILLFGGYACFAQDKVQTQIDSLKQINRNVSILETTIDNNNQIASLFNEINTDSTVFYSRQSLILAGEKGYPKGKADAHLMLARALIEKGMFPQAIENYNNALAYFEKINDKEKILNVYRGIAYAFSYGASQIECLEYSLKALAVAEELNDSATLPVIYNNLATTYKKLDDYKSALYYFERTLDEDLKANDSLNMAISYSNIGVLKTDNQKYEEAAKDYHQLKLLLPNLKNDYLRAYFYLSLAGYYTATEQFYSAQICITKADKLCKEYDFQHIKARVYRRSGELLFAQKIYSKSIEAFNKCLELSQQIGIVEEFPRIYSFKAQAYSELGNYKAAFQAQQNENKFRESAQNKKVAFALAEFENQQKTKIVLEKQALEQKLLAKQAENETIQLRLELRITLITICLLLLSVIIFFYFFLKLRKNKNVLHSQHQLINKQKELLEENFSKLQLSEKSLQKINAAKDKLFSIIAHDLRSPFNAILGFSNELSDSFELYSDEEKKEMISLISNSSESTLFLLENLLNWARAQGESIEITKRNYPLKKLLNESISPFMGSAQQKKLSVVVNTSENVLIYSDKETIKVVISNLFNNAIKFSNIAGEILISGNQKDNCVEICIQDSGIGMTKEIRDNLFIAGNKTQRQGTSNEKGTGLGLALCHEFVQLNNGKIWVKSEDGKGCCFFISLPVEKN